MLKHPEPMVSAWERANMDTDTKTCAKCKLEKPRSEFRRHNYSLDGLEKLCVRCRPTGGPSTKTPEERFEEKYEIRDAGYVTPCWVWTNALNKHGYGSFRPGGSATCVGAHIWSYERHNGTVPNGMELDHLCRNRSCVRHDHLEPVTSQVNTLRGYTPAAENAAKTHCIAGHPLSEDNLYFGRNGRMRGCRICRRANKKRHIAKLRRTPMARVVGRDSH